MIYMCVKICNDLNYLSSVIKMFVTLNYLKNSSKCGKIRDIGYSQYKSLLILFKIK